MLKIRRFLNRDILNISEIEEYLDRKLIKPDARAEKWSNDIKRLGMNDAKTSELLKFCALNIFTKIDNFTNHLADFVYSFTLDEIDDERLENDGISCRGGGACWCWAMSIQSLPTAMSR